MVVPIQLGCCPHGTERCLLCPPAPEPPSSELVAAMIEHYRTERAAGAPLLVRFFGGEPPNDAQVEALGGLPFEIRVRPDLLPRERAAELQRQGLQAVELDAHTFHRPALIEAGRPYSPDLVRQMSRTLRGMGLRVGGVLTIGLPRSSHETCLQDAAEAAQLWSTVRLHPLLVLRHSRLRTWHEQGLYAPLRVGEAVTTVLEMMHILEAAGVTVTRVGMQPGPDGFGKAVAGPRHSSLRELVEARRVRETLMAQLQAAGIRGGAVTLRCHPADISRVKGPLQQHIRDFRARFQLDDVFVRADDTLVRGTFRVEITS